MTRVGLLLCTMFLVAQVALAQSPWHLRLRGGIMLGGPIPTQSDPDSSSGRLAIGPAGGVYVSRQLSARWRIEAGLSYAYKGATYQQLFRNDTLMPIEIFPGRTDTVPTYYYADVHGQMQLHYLELPISLEWQIARRTWLQVGAYVGALLGGHDAGTVDIQIGDGSIFPDTTTAFDNIAQIRRLDVGLTLGGSYELDNGLFFDLRAQRSLRSLYQRGFLSSQVLPEVALYHTQFYLGLGWRF